VSDPVLREIAAVLDTEDARSVRARRAAEIVRAARGYRWVGVYDVGDEEFELIGHTGVQAPAFVRFPLGDGLSGEAVRTRETVVGSGAREMVVPILGAESGIAIGTLDVEGDRAFDDEDRGFVERCTLALVPLFE
jgi:putative methionine-R-sulfoxide reductase with GAF domain